MRVLLALTRYAGLAARVFVSLLLLVPYVLGLVAALVVEAGSSVAAAARLGWTDVRRPRRGGHGAA